MSAEGPALDRFRVATWNVNSLKARASGLDRLLARTAPDVLLVQETKSGVVHADAQAVLERHGYGIEHVGSGAYNGVAVASRHTMRATCFVTSGCRISPSLSRVASARSSSE